MSAFDAYIKLSDTIDGSVLWEESMARHTTYRIGGPAQLFIECASLASLGRVVDVLKEECVPWVVSGKGSNLLVSDKGYEGAVIVLVGEFGKQDFSEAERLQEAGEFEKGKTLTVSAGAGCVLSRLVQKSFSMGLSGFEFAVGIPGTFGGALRMNAGSADKWIGSVVSTVTTYVPHEGLKMYRAQEIDWGYRSSSIPPGEIVVEASINLSVADEMTMRAQMEASLNRRKATQPYGQRCCGSVFRNPEGAHAAALIEECGLKGVSCGGAQISDKHANFVVNTGTATSEEVLTLIHLIRDRVEETHGIRLKPEVKFLGFPQ